MSDLFANTPLPSRFDKVEKTDLTGVEQVALRADSRDVELTRRFERAENLKRQDLNAASAFDVAAIGQFGQEIFQQEVNDVRQMIVSGELDPVEARAKIGELTSLYGQFSAHADAMKDKDAEALGLIEDPAKREAYQKRMGIGEELSYGADDYAIQHNLALNGVFERGSAQKVNGQWTVIDPNTGQRVPFSQVTGFADPNHFYRYGTKAVDVGTLDDWAKSKSTVSAIGFRDGKWDEGRARSTYRDNILTVDDIGRTHRLQLLGTLEDRGLVDHLTDEQKRAFRNGDYTVQTTGDGQQIIVDANGQRLTAFEEIIAKGEDEFVERSRFDMTIGDGKKGSGSGSGESLNFVVGGLNVPQAGAAERADLSNPQMEQYIADGGALGHNLNRFNDGKAPTITGTYIVPNHPNTKKVTIVAAGVNELGQRVAMIIGEQIVQTPSALGPDFPPNEEKKSFDMEIPIGEDLEGVSRDVYQEIYQNHPQMAQQIEADRNARYGVRVDNMTPQEPQQEQTLDLSDAQKQQIERYNNLKQRRDKIVDDLANSLGLTREEGESEDDFISRLMSESGYSKISEGSSLPSGPAGFSVFFPSDPDSDQGGGRKTLLNNIISLEEQINALSNDKALGPIIAQLEGGESATPAAGNQEASEDPFERVEDMVKESNRVIANAPDDVKDQVSAKIDEALPEKLFAYETQNSAGEKAIGFKNEAGEDTGEMIFFS